MKVAAGFLFIWPCRTKENAMRNGLAVGLLGAVVALGLSSAHAQTRAGRGHTDQVVIVFKDGHRQSFNLSDIARIEFPGGPAVADAGPTPSGAPPRGHFVGKWDVGDGAGSTFSITLNDDGSAWRSLQRVHGRWAYVNGEARVTWDDGAQDCIRRIDGHDQKFAYHAGKSFSDEPDNVTDARNTSPRPL
jgi:hypothetical protein